MKKKYLVIIVSLMLFFFSSVAQALEADQYQIWKKEEGLKDATAAVNQNMNMLLQQFLDKYINVKSTRTEPQSCDQVAFRFLRYVRPHFFLNRFKTFAYGNEQIEFYPQDANMFKDYSQSIYKGFQWPFLMPVAQTVKINGVYLGTDKLDHFFSSGRRYYNVYRDALKKGLRHEEALKKALDFGLSIFEEKGVLGYWSSGAFSYADIEANYQGMMLGINMCEGEEPTLAYVKDNGWIIEHPIDMKDRVNPLWDEAYNNSYFFPYRWNGVKKVLLETYCRMGLTPRVQAIWHVYDHMVQNTFHVQYMQELMKNGKVPNPWSQSLNEVCAYPDGVMEGVPFWKEVYSTKTK